MSLPDGYGMFPASASSLWVCKFCSAVVMDTDKHNDWHKKSGYYAVTIKGTRVPDPFVVTDEMAAWAEEHCPLVDWGAESQVFLDYWRAKPGAAGVKLDWPATWRNWMRRKA